MAGEGEWREKRSGLRGLIQWFGLEVTVSGLDYNLRPVGITEGFNLGSSLLCLFRFVCAVVRGWFAGSQDGLRGARQAEGQLKTRIPALSLALSQAHKPSWNSCQ